MRVTCGGICPGGSWTSARHLLEKRQGLMEDVFAGAEEKLREYTATPAYRERLRQSVSEVVGRLTEEGQVPLILYFAPQDQDKWEELRPLCPGGQPVGSGCIHPGWAASGGRTGFAA